MKALAIDTSNDYLSLALCNQEAILAYHEQVGQQHAEFILPTIRRLLSNAQQSIGQLDAIIYGNGPGAFTGLRVGAGIAKGLALPYDIPLIPIPTLDAIAVQYIVHQAIFVAVDARMRQVYWRCYLTQNQRLIPEGLIAVNSPSDIPLSCLSIGVGSGLAAYQAMLSDALLACLTEQYPHAKPTGQAYITLAKTECYPKVSADQADLLYIRNHVALTLDEQRKLRT